MWNVVRGVVAGLLVMCAGTACGEDGGTAFEVVGKAPPVKRNSTYRLQVSSNAKHVAWLNKLPGRPAAVSVSLDCVEGPALDWMAAGESFSPDGERFVYIGYQNDRCLLVVDGVAKQVAKGTEDPRFGADSKGLAYVTWEDVPGNDKQRVIVVEGAGGMRKIAGVSSGAFALSPDGKHVAYSMGDYKQVTLMVDGEARKSYEMFRGGISAIRFSPNSKRVSYGVDTASDVICACDGIADSTCQQLWSTEFSPDGSKFVSIGLVPSSNRSYPTNYELRVDGVKVGTYTKLELPVFSGDGKRMAYLASPVDAPYFSFVVVDGVEGARHRKVSGPVFSPDGKHVAYAVKQMGMNIGGGANGACVVQDGVEGPRHSGQIFDPVFSPDSRHMAYRVVDIASAPGKAVDWRDRIVLDGVEQRVYSATTTPAFSPDSKHVAYCASRGGKAFLVVDKSEGEPFDQWLGEGTVCFESAHRVRSLGVKDGMVVRVVREVR
jgi:hypothetical protein